MRCGGLGRNRTGVQGFAVLCVTTPPRGLNAQGVLWGDLLTEPLMPDKPAVNFFSRLSTFPSRAAPTTPLSPPDFRAPTPPPHSRELVGKDQKAERDHPKPEHGQETEASANDKQAADDDSRHLRSWHHELTSEDGDRPRFFAVLVFWIIHTAKPRCQLVPRAHSCAASATYDDHSCGTPYGSHTKMGKTTHCRFANRKSVCYRQPRSREQLFPGSSVVEQPAVNRLVAGSNPARGATLKSIT